MPRLWDETIEAHRQAVRDATLDTTAALVAERGLRAVTMSEIAERTGIGRATLYKYFPDVEAILAEWHVRQIEGHLARLAEVADEGGNPLHRLEAVLRAYATIQVERRSHGRDTSFGTEMAAMLHRDEHLADAQHRVLALIRDLVIEAVGAGFVRDDIPAQELAAYCVHALSATGHTSSDAAVHRIVTVTMAGLRPG